MNFSQLLSHTDNHRRDYRLAPSFNFYRDFGDKAELTKSSLAINNHQHLDYMMLGALKLEQLIFRISPLLISK